MGFWAWLTRKGRERDQSAAQHQVEAEQPPEIRSQPEFIEIPSRRFYGQCVKSPNGRYTLAWRDGNGVIVADSGARRAVRGGYLLLDRGTIVAEGRISRPNDGKVADNGVFILNDWGSANTLSGTFFAFAPDGRQILERKFKANLFNNGLSANGHLAACQTCNSPDEADSALLTVFDLVGGNEIGSWRPQSGWPRSYEFPDDGNTILLGYPEAGLFRYSVSGDFIDRERWIDAALSRGNLYLAEDLLKEISVSSSTELVVKILHCTEVAFAAPHNDSRTRAFSLKLRGRCFEAMRSPAAALDCYEKALALDPKVGVKRRMDQLRKRASVPPGET